MIDTRAVQSQAEARRRDLLADGRPRRPVPGRPQAASTVSERSAVSGPARGRTSVPRAVAPRVGAWLIAWGTRLGGTSVRTS